MTDPEPLDLEPIRARHAATTNGTWATCEWHNEDGDIDYVTIETKPDGRQLKAVAHVVWKHQDADFIKAAHNTDVPALLAEVERLRAEARATRAIKDPPAHIAATTRQINAENHALRTLLDDLTETFMAVRDRVISTDSRDWTANYFDAWLYGVFVGWTDQELAELAMRYVWSPAALQHLRERHAMAARPIPEWNPPTDQGAEPA